MTTQSIQEVSDYIKERIKNSDINIISIDGWTDAGKSYLLENLEVEANKLSIDNYIDKHKDQYVDVVRYVDLKNVMGGLKGLQIIEGICIQKVLEMIETTPDITIYVKRLAARVYWSEEEYVNKESAEEVFKEDDTNLEFDVITGEKREISDAEKELTEKRQGAFYDLVKYHYEYTPHINSDVIYERLAE